MRWWCCTTLSSDEEIRTHGFAPGPVEGANVVILNTAHGEYLTLPFPELAASGLRLVADGRNQWSRERGRSNWTDVSGRRPRLRHGDPGRPPSDSDHGMHIRRLASTTDTSLDWEACRRPRQS